MTTLDEIRDGGSRHVSKAPLPTFLCISKTTRRWIAFLMIITALFTLSTLFTGPSVIIAQEQRIEKDKGMLTAVLQRAVIIDGKGYNINGLTKIFDVNAKRCKIDDLKVPVNIWYEYAQSPQGPVILLIKVVGR